MADQPAIQLDESEILADMPESEQVEETTAPESSTEETKPEEVTSDEEPAEDKDTEGDDESDDESQEESDEEVEAEDTKDDQPKSKSAAGRKAQLTNEIKGLLAQREALRQDVIQRNAQAGLRAPTVQELEAQGADEATARVQALEQNLEIEKYNNQVANLATTLNTEALQVMHDYPVFDQNSPLYNPELAQLGQAMYQSVANVQVDPRTGLPYAANATPYPVYQALAEAFNSGAKTSQVKAQRSAERMMASAEAPTSAAPPEPKEDAFLAGLTKGLKTN